MNKPVSFIAYHGSVEDNLELEPNKAFYLCASYKLAKEFAYREVYRDGLYEGDVPMIYKFKGTFKNPYYMTEEEYDDEGQDSNIDFQKWVDMGVDGIVIPNRQTYYVVIDPSTIRLIGKKYLPFDEESLERTDDRINDKDDMPMINEEVDYQNEVEILLNPSTNEFKHFMKPKHWYRMCLTNDKVIVWDANTSILHQDVDNEYGLENSEHIFIHKGKPYLQDYDLDDYLENEMDSILFVAKQIDNNPMFKRYFPNHSMEVDIHKAIDNDGKYIVEEYEGLNRIAGFYWFDDKKFQMLKRKPMGVEKLDPEDNEFDYYHLDDNGLEEDNKARFGIEKIGQKLVCYIEAEDKQKCLIAKKAIQRKFNDILIDKFQLSWGRNNFEELCEEIVYGEMEDDEMVVILHNPSRKELKDNHLDDECRIVYDGNNGYYFASSQFTHEQIEQKLQANNLPYVETSGEFYYYQDNLFATRDDWSSEKEYQEYKNDWYKSLKSMPYIVKNFGNFKVEIFKGEYLSESVYPENKYVFPYPDWGNLADIIDPDDNYRYWVDGIKAKIKNPQLKNIPVNKIRQDYDGDDDMIEYDYNQFDNGINEPIKVVKYKDQYILMDGHHRAAYSKVNGLKTIKAYVYDADELENLNESIAYAESNNDDLVNVILKNPTRKELRDNNILNARCMESSEGDWYFCDATIMTHSNMVYILRNNTFFPLYDGNDYYGIAYYDYNTNTFLYNLNDYMYKQECIKQYNDSYYLQKTFPSAKIINNPHNEQGYDDLYETLILDEEYEGLNRLTGFNWFDEKKFHLQLNEGIEDVKRYFPKITNEDFTKLINLDPTYQGGNELGKYGKWILGLYNTFLKDKEAYQKWEEQKKLGNNFPEPSRKSQEQIEDFEKIPAILKDYDVMNTKLRVNINNVKSVAELYKIVNDAKNEGISNNSKVNHAIDLVKKSIEKGGEVVFKDSNWVILIPKTLASSVVFGDDTNWCTTAPNGEKYEYYKKEYGGEYYINANLKDGSLYQFHFESNQFMDKNDNPISCGTFLNNNLSLKQFYQKKVQQLEDENIYKLLYGNLSDKEIDNIISLHTRYFVYVTNPSEKLLKKVVKMDPSSIIYIQNPSEAVQLATVKTEGDSIQYIKNPSTAVQLAAVKQDAYAIEYIKNPTEEMQLIAVKRSSQVIGAINNPSESVQLAAVKYDYEAIAFINNPTEAVQLEAVKQYGCAIEYIKNPTEKVQLEAVKQDIDAIEYIKNPTEKVKALHKKLYGKLNESNEQYISESVLDYGTPMIFPDPTYSEFHRIMRDHTTYGKLSAVIDRGHIYCWDSGMAHHHQMIKHIENQIGERLSDNAIWVRFKEPNWVWVSAEYFNEYDDDELDDLGTQDFEKELENNPIIKKYFPRGIVIKRFNNLVESFKKVSDDSYVMEITSYNDIKPFIQRYCSFGARGLLNTNNNKVYLADVMALTHGDMVNDLKENGESIDYDSVIQFMVYPSQETAMDSEYAEYWNEGDDRIQFVTNDDIYVLFKQYNFMNDKLNKILKMNTMDDVEREDDMNGFVITESIHFNDMAYNNAFNKFEELTVWKNPSIDWLQNELENIDLRFIYNPDANMLYVWNGSKWMHSEVMDNVDMKMSSNVNIIGVLSPSVVEIWAEISPNDNANEAKSLTRKYMGKLLKDIYPDGYQLIAYT